MSVARKFVSTDNLEQNVWHKVQKPSKTVFKQKTRKL